MSEPTRYGWPAKIVWVEKKGYTGSVIIQGREWLGGRPLWFQAFKTRQLPHPDARTDFILNPRRPTVHLLRHDPRQPGRLIVNQKWIGFTARLLIPRAGCYVLVAHWPGGTWSIPFAAGR